MDLDLVLRLALLHTSGDWVDPWGGVGGSVGWRGWINGVGWVGVWVNMGVRWVGI